MWWRRWHWRRLARLTTPGPSGVWGPLFFWEMCNPVFVWGLLTVCLSFLSRPHTHTKRHARSRMRLPDRPASFTGSDREKSSNRERRAQTELYNKPLLCTQKGAVWFMRCYVYDPCSSVQMPSTDSTVLSVLLYTFLDTSRGASSSEPRASERPRPQTSLPCPQSTTSTPVSFAPCNNTPLL